MVIIIAFSLLFIGASIHIQICMNKYIYSSEMFPEEDDKLFSMIKYTTVTSILRDRNGMIWAIGQLADKRALNHLLDLYTG